MQGRSVDYKELVSMTANSIISIIKEDEPHYIPINATLYLKDGGDGAGSMPKLKSAQSTDDAEHIFQYGLIPLRLTEKNNEHKETVKWENSVMNSARSFRSVFTIREKEDNHELLELVIKSIDGARRDLNENGTLISVGGQNVHLSCNIKDTMKDLKFKKMISGLGGADCLLCKSKQNDWTNPAMLEDETSFQINRTDVNTREIFLSVIDEEGNIQSSQRTLKRDQV